MTRKCPPDDRTSPDRAESCRIGFVADYQRKVAAKSHAQLVELRLMIFRENR
ncbi:hypothetical protein HMPREF9069_01052 [Atopobium sp. oral taxon 810 str. F0209]|nr:hypothetical protein HMPREF9069_01052 [Atopobium sp. oral taxon 810 str. F0209]